MDQAAHNQVMSFIWGIADDVLRDLFKRGKYPDVILPMFVPRRLDAALEPGGVEAFFRREVLPYTPDAWLDEGKTQIDYEISFTRHFYKPQPLRTLEEIRADILAVRQEGDRELADLLGETP